MNVTFVPEKFRISVERYQKMVSAGILTKRDRIELIDGEMVSMAPIGSQHAALTARLNRLFVRAVGDAAIVSPGGPVNLGEFSEPEPDLMGAAHSCVSRAGEHWLPSDAGLRDFRHRLAGRVSRRSGEGA